MTEINPMTKILVDVPIYEPGLKTLEAIPDVEVTFCDPITDEKMVC